VPGSGKRTLKNKFQNPLFVFALQIRNGTPSLCEEGIVGEFQNQDVIITS
jgi:hypothetical protein